MSDSAHGAVPAGPARDAAARVPTGRPDELVRTAEPTIDDHRRALTEVSFLLDIFAAATDELMGGATASVGRIAGRRLADKLPVHLPQPTLPGVLDCLAQQLGAGFAMTHRVTPDGAEVRVGRCAIREVCAVREEPPGGRLCRLFHYTLDGMVNEWLHRPVKSEIGAAGATCLLRLAVR